MRVTCPKCQLQGLVDTGPLSLQPRVLCVRCATSYEVALNGAEAANLLPAQDVEPQASKAQASEVASVNDFMEGDGLVGENVPAAVAPSEAEPPAAEEPLELPGPLMLVESVPQGEAVLDELLAKSPFKQDASAAEAELAFTQEEPPAEEVLSLEEEERTDPVEPTKPLEAEPLELESAWPSEQTMASEVRMADWPATDSSAVWQSREDEPPARAQVLADEENEVLELTAREEEREEELDEDEEEAAFSALSSSFAALSSSASSIAPSAASDESLISDESSASVASSSPATSFEARVLPASATEAELRDALLDTSTAPERAAAVDAGQPVGLAQPCKETMPLPDKDGSSVRLMRVSPVWLLGSGLLFVSLIFIFNWATKPNAQANDLALSRSLNGISGQTARQNAASSQPKAAEKPARTVEQNPAAQPGTAPSGNQSSISNGASPADPAQVYGQAANGSQPATGAPARNSASAQNSAAANPAPARKDVEVAMNASRGNQTSPPAEASQPQPERETSGGNFTVQVGSYSDNAQAQSRVASLKSAGVDARVLEVSLPGRGNWYRVQAGRFATRDEAARYQQQLRAQRVAPESIVAEIR